MKKLNLLGTKRRISDSKAETINTKSNINVGAEINRSNVIVGAEINRSNVFVGAEINRSNVFVGAEPIRSINPNGAEISKQQRAEINRSNVFVGAEPIRLMNPDGAEIPKIPKSIINERDEILRYNLNVEYDKPDTNMNDPIMNFEKDREAMRKRVKSQEWEEAARSEICNRDILRMSEQVENHEASNKECITEERESKRREGAEKLRRSSRVIVRTCPGVSFQAKKGEVRLNKLNRRI